jgi:hypothetical protein
VPLAGRPRSSSMTSRSPLGVELPDLAALQRMPAIMNLYLSIAMVMVFPVICLG